MTIVAITERIMMINAR